jgi:alkylation response protein AidB-like acyl-CoA dehydrogenase
MCSTPPVQSEDVERFRARAAGWLAANAEQVAHDSNTAKARLTATAGMTVDDQRAEVAAAKAWQRRVFDAGFAGIAVPAEYGGQGLTAAHAAAWREEAAPYARPAGPTALGNALALPAILHHGTEAQKRRHIPPILRGDAGWCQLFSEPGAGSDLAGLTTRAEPNGDGWIVTGQKVWNSFAHLADWGLLLARTDWDVPKHRGITYLLVDMKEPGVEARPLRQATGSAEFNETFLTDVHVPADAVLGAVNGGWGVIQTTLTNERAGLTGIIGFSGIDWDAWVEHARAHGALDTAVTRDRMARMYTRWRLAGWLQQRIDDARRAGIDPGPQSSVVKLLGTIDIDLGASLGVDLQGAAGMLAGNDAVDGGAWQQLFLGQWSPRIGGGTEQIQRNVIGERILGLPPEPRTDKDRPFREVLRN